MPSERNDDMRWKGIPHLVAIVGLLAVSCGSDTDTPVVTESDVTEQTVIESSPEVDSDAADDIATTTPVTTVQGAENTTPATVPPTGDSAFDDDFLDLVESGDVDVAIDVPEGGVSGELLNISMTNNSDDDLAFVVLGGLVFSPEDYVEPPDGEPGSDDQRMINLTPIEVELDPGESTVILPYVMCIDSAAPAPGPGAVYVIDELATGELLALAECISDGDLLDEYDPATGNMSVQIAMWATADGELPDLDGALAETDGALSDMIGSEVDIDFDAIAELLEAQGIDADLPELEGIDLEAMLEQATTFFDQYLDGANDVLDQCSIDLSN